MHKHTSNRTQHIKHPSKHAKTQKRMHSSTNANTLKHTSKCTRTHTHTSMYNGRKTQNHTKTQYNKTRTDKRIHSTNTSSTLKRTYKQIHSIVSFFNILIVQEGYGMMVIMSEVVVSSSQLLLRTHTCAPTQTLHS